LLARSRHLFADGYYTGENFLDAGTRSLQAVEQPCARASIARKKIAFAKLIDRALADGLADERTRDLLHPGRQLRNEQVHATALSYFSPAIAATVIGTPHVLVAEIFEHDAKVEGV
jgi:hypothetical protein